MTAIGEFPQKNHVSRRVIFLNFKFSRQKLACCFQSMVSMLMGWPNICTHLRYNTFAIHVDTRTKVLEQSRSSGVIAPCYSSLSGVVAQIGGSAPRNRSLTVGQRGRATLYRAVSPQGGRQSSQQTNKSKQQKRLCDPIAKRTQTSDR